IPQYEPPFLVWTHWKEGAAALTERLQREHPALRFAHVSGDTPNPLRDVIIEGFKAGDHGGLVLSLGVGKFGHTLTNVKTMVSLDRNFSADDYFQSMHRV